MARTADLLSVLHQIDTLRGKVCGTCTHYDWRFPTHGFCRQGYAPCGPDDGCDEWYESPVCRPRTDNEPWAK